MYRKIPEMPFIIAGTALAYLYPFFSGWLSLVWRGIGYIGIGGVLVLLYILSKKRSSRVAVPLLWALIIHIYSLAALVLDFILPFSFMGTTYLAVTIALVVMIKKLPAWKSEWEHLRFGKIDGVSVLLIVIVSVVGMGMVFIWGIFLGILRRRTEGMLAPFLAHVAADMTIFGILCGLYL